MEDLDLSNPYLWIGVGLVAIILWVFREKSNSILKQNEKVYGELKQFNNFIKDIIDVFKKFNDTSGVMNESLTDVIATENEIIKELKSIPKFIQRTDYLDKKLTSLESLIKTANNSQSVISKFNENSKAFQKAIEEQRKLIKEVHGETSKLKEPNTLAKLINDPKIQEQSKTIQFFMDENKNLKAELQTERDKGRSVIQEREGLIAKNKQLLTLITTAKEENAQLREEKGKLERKNEGGVEM